jgi:hypothetical protein
MCSALGRAGVASDLTDEDYTEYVKATVHWQKVGFSGILQNLCFTDGH